MGASQMNTETTMVTSPSPRASRRSRGVARAHVSRSPATTLRRPDGSRTAAAVEVAERASAAPHHAQKRVPGGFWPRQLEQVHPVEGVVIWQHCTVRATGTRQGGGR